MALSDRLLFEIIAIELWHPDRPERDANFVVDHKVCQPYAINEDDTFHRSGELHGLRRECGGSNEDALASALARKCSIERLHFWATDGLLPSLRLRLHVDPFQAELVQRDDSVYSAIACPADPLQVCPARPVPHAVQKIEDDGLEETGRDLSYRFADLGGHSPAQLGEGLLKPIVRARRP
jgi:hypothetical protein